MIIDTFLKSVEPVYTSSVLLLLAFNLKKRQRYFFLFLFADIKINHTFVGALIF